MRSTQSLVDAVARRGAGRLAKAIVLAYAEAGSERDPGTAGRVMRKINDIIGSPLPPLSNVDEWRRIAAELNGERYGWQSRKDRIER